MANTESITADMIIDFHSHILPNIDDGSKSVEESLEMLRIMKSQGIDAVVATPHFYGSEDYPESFLERRAKAKELLLEAIGSEELPTLYFGAEVEYFRGMSRSKALKSLAIEKTNAILVEMPIGKWTDLMYDELEQIYTYQGLIPIVAHVDRYMTPFRDFGIPGRLAELPVLVQANASFFLKKNTVKKAQKLLERDLIHLLGSDTHNLVDRAPNLGMALNVIKESPGSRALERIESWQNKVIHNKVL